MARIKKAHPDGPPIIRTTATFVVITECSFKPKAIQARLAAGCKVMGSPEDKYRYTITFNVYSDTNVEEKTRDILRTITDMEVQVGVARRHQKALTWLRKVPHHLSLSPEVVAALEEIDRD